MEKIIHNKQLICLFIISTLGCFSGAMLAPIEMPFVQSILNDLSKASFVFTVSTVASVFGIFLINSLVNKFNSKKTLYIFMPLAILFPILYSNVFNILEVYGIKFSWILCTAGFAPIFESLFQNKIAKIDIKPGVFYGLLYSVQAFAGMLGTFLGGVISDISGYNMVFYILTLIAAIQFMIFIKMSRLSNESDYVNNDNSKKMSLVKGIKYSLQNIELRTRLVLATSFAIAWSSKVILYPLIIMQLTDLNTMTGLAMSLQGLVAMIALPVIGKIVDMRGYRNVLVFGYILLAVSLFIFGISDSIVLLFASAILIALAESCNGPSMGALEVINIPEEMRNSIKSFLQMYVIIINVIATAGIGILLYICSAQDIMIIISIIVFMTYIYALLVYRKHIYQTKI